MSQKPKPAGNHFVALDGARGIGALTIVTGHAIEVLGHVELVPHMQAAVDLFFALSGFVVGLAYQPRLEAGASVSDYMVRRLIRLYPLLPLAVLWGAVTFLIKAFIHGDAPVSRVIGSALLNALFLPSPLLNEESGNLGWAINVPLWSLTSEMLVSVLFGAALWKMRTRGLLAIAALGAVGFALCAVRLHHTNIGPGWYELDAMLVRPLYPFCIGLWMWRLTRGRSPSGRIPSSLLLAFTMLVFWVPRVAAQETQLDLWFGLFLTWVIMPALLYVLAFMARTSDFSSRVWRMLGDTSFAVYVLHFPLIMVVHFIGKRIGLIENAPALLVLLDVVLSLAMGWAATRYYDEPVRHWLTKLSKKHFAQLATLRPRAEPASTKRPGL